MIQSSVGHLQFNIDGENNKFYKDLFLFLGWKLLYESADMVGMEDSRHASIWFTSPYKKVSYDYDGPGVNHFAISVPNQVDVDETVAYLIKHNVSPLFDTPRHRPEFCGSDKNTYYQVMFESPDRILFEVVYTGPKQ